MNRFQRALACALLAAAPLSVAGCNGGALVVATPSQSVEANTLEDSQIGDRMTTITLLGFDGCPLTPLMKGRLETALRQLDQSMELVQLDQQSLEPSDLRRGYPAPTVLVHGSDLFGMAPPSAPSIGCRMYDGPGGVPSIDELTERLVRVLSSGSGMTGGGA